MEIKQEESKQVEDTTTNQPAPVEEKNDDSKPPVQVEENQEEQVTLSKKELEDLRKRATDFDRSIELKRLAKLGNQPKPVDAEVTDEIQALKDKLSSLEAKSYNDSLAEAYRSFTSENPWLNDDSKFDKLKENFVAVGTETKDELLSKFKMAAQTTFPTEYEKHLEDRIKAKILSSKTNIPDGGAANSATTIHEDNKQKTEEDAHKERLSSLLDKHTSPWLKK